MSLVACSSSSNEEALRAQRERVRTLIEQDQYKEALAAQEEIVKLSPKDDEAYYQLARLHLRLGRPEDINLAHHALLKVVKLKGSRIDARLQLAQLYLLSGQADNAAQHADAILEVEPTNSNGHLVKGVILISYGRFQNGIAEFRKAIEFDAANRAAYLEMARAYVQQRNFTEAETVLRDSLSRDPKSVAARIALGDVLAAAGKESEAVQEYRRGLEEERNNGDLYVRLAALHRKAHQIQEAESDYQQWIAAQPNSADPLMALGQFYARTARWKEAETTYQKARQVDPTSRIAHEALINFFLDTRRLKEAASEIEAFLKPAQSDITGRLLQARLLLEEGGHEKALPLLQELVHQAPKLAIVHQYLGIARARHHDLPQAITSLKEARKHAPDSSDIRASLAQAYLAQGSLSLALSEGEAAIELDPQNIAALKILTDVQARAGNMKRAEELVKETLVLQPHDAVLHHRLGSILVTQRRLDEALRHYEEALKRDPALLESLEQIAAILVAQKRMVEAQERTVRHVALYPKSAHLQNVLGRVFMEGKNWPKSEAAFRKAITLDNELLSSYVNLGELYARQGKIEMAVSELERVLKKSPKQSSVLMLLGMLHEQQRDFSRAMARYEEVLQIDPRVAPAANNLAWLLLEHTGDKERALVYAERAWKAAPSDPNFADTLGWVYFKKQMYPKAAGLLKEAVDQLPDHPTILYHYGMAQYWNDNNAEAKKSLTKFLKLSPNNPDAAEAKKVLAAL
jgi:tetratricopeptide (TPR) repeat protein